MKEKLAVGIAKFITLCFIPGIVFYDSDAVMENKLNFLGKVKVACILAWYSVFMPPNEQ